MWRPRQQERLAKVGESSSKAAFPLQRLTNALEMRTPGVTQVFIFLTHKFKARFVKDPRNYLYFDNYQLLVVKKRLLHKRVYLFENRRDFLLSTKTHKFNSFSTNNNLC